MTIAWKLSNRTYEAIYYKTTCWFDNIEYDQVLDITSAPKSDSPPAPSQPGDATNIPAVTNTSLPQKWKSSPRLDPFGTVDMPHNIVSVGADINIRWNRAVYRSWIHRTALSRSAPSHLSSFERQIPCQYQMAFYAHWQGLSLRAELPKSDISLPCLPPFLPHSRYASKGLCWQPHFDRIAKSVTESMTASENEYIAPVGAVARGVVGLVSWTTWIPIGCINSTPWKDRSFYLTLTMRLENEK